MSSFGFDKVKKPAEQGERKLDLSGLTMQPPAVPADKEQRAIKKGEELGFTSREPSETKERKGEGEGRAMRRHRELRRDPFMSRARHPSWTGLWLMPMNSKRTPIGRF